MNANQENDKFINIMFSAP